MPDRDYLFVLAAHIPDSYNRDLLNATLHSILLHHPNSPTLLVDNASPDDSIVPSAIAALPVAAREFIMLRRQQVSHGMLGSWHEADAYLRRDNKIARIVLLQHSTRLLRPLPPVDGSCVAIALGGTEANHSSAWLSHTSASMKWASAKANQLKLPCGPQCRLSRNAAATLDQVCTHWEACDDWSAALHSTLLLSRTGFTKLSEMGLWPRLNSHGKLVHISSFSRSVWQTTHGESKVAMPHAGLEILAGILIARLNNYPTPPDRCSCTDCTEKRHGNTNARNKGVG